MMGYAMLKKVDGDLWKVRVIYLELEEAHANSGSGDKIVPCDLSDMRIEGFAASGDGMFLEAPKAEVDEEVRGLLKWRDELALDWYGDELVLHVMCVLKHLNRDRVPDAHRRGFDKWQSMGEEERYRAAEAVLNTSV